MFWYAKVKGVLFNNPDTFFTFVFCLLMGIFNAFEIFNFKPLCHLHILALNIFTTKL